MSDMPTIPADLAEVIATHRAMFGGFTMMADEAPATPTPADLAQQAQQRQSEQQPAEQPKSEFTDDETGEKYGFPAKTPLSEMTAEQKAEYWRHKARKHEDRNRENGRGEDRKGEAKEGQPDADAIRKDAERAALARYAPVAVKAEFKAAFGASRTAAQVDAILETLDLTKFLTSKGEVDTDKVIQTADAIAPKGGGAGTSGPDMGQGNRGASHISKAEAGRLAAERRHGKK